MSDFRAARSGRALSGALESQLGPFLKYVKDPDVSNLHFNPSGAVTIDRPGGLWEKVGTMGQTELARFLQGMAGELGLVLDDETSPTLETSYGAMRIVMSTPSASGGYQACIRFQAEHRLSLDELVGFGMLTEAESAFLVREVVEGKSNICVAGATNSGKTTLMGAVYWQVLQERPYLRVVTLEERSPELFLERDAVNLGSEVGCQVVPYRTKAGGTVGMTELLRLTLRSTPERVVLGEVRGPEAWILFQACQTGHKGTILSLHAGNPKEALRQLTSFANYHPNVHLEPHDWAQVIDLVVVCEYHQRRRVTGIYSINWREEEGQIEIKRLEIN